LFQQSRAEQKRRRNGRRQVESQCRCKTAGLFLLTTRTRWCRQQAPIPGGRQAQASTGSTAGTWRCGRQVGAGRQQAARWQVERQTLVVVLRGNAGETAWSHLNGPVPNPGRNGSNGIPV